MVLKIHIFLLNNDLIEYSGIVLFLPFTMFGQRNHTHREPPNFLAVDLVHTMLIRSPGLGSNTLKCIEYNYKYFSMNMNMNIAQYKAILVFVFILFVVVFNTF